MSFSSQRNYYGPPFVSSLTLAELSSRRAAAEAEAKNWTDLLEKLDEYRRAHPEHWRAHVEPAIRALLKEG